MSKLLIPATATALFAAMSLAYAADATGVIKSMDMTKDTVTLDNGSTYTAPTSVKLSSFKVGEKVAITYTEAKGEKEISVMKSAS